MMVCLNQWKGLRFIYLLGNNFFSQNYLAKNLPEKIHETKDHNQYDQCYDEIGQ
jgi:hypothetical protein